MSCHRCGACCTYLIIEVEPEDVIREPRIADVLGKERLTAEEAENRGGWGETYVLAPRMVDGELVGCPLLTSAMSAPPAVRLCAIHATKPDVCRQFPPGGIQCMKARRMAGADAWEKQESARRGAKTLRVGS